MNSLYSILWTKDHENNKVLSDHCDETPGEHSCHQFFEMLRRKEDIAAVSKFVDLGDDHHFYFMKVTSCFDSSYFNPKSNGQEFLVEPWHLLY